MDSARDVADVARLALREFRTPEAAIPSIQGLAHPNPRRAPRPSSGCAIYAVWKRSLLSFGQRTTKILRAT